MPLEEKRGMERALIGRLDAHGVEKIELEGIDLVSQYPYGRKIRVYGN